MKRFMSTLVVALIGMLPFAGTASAATYPTFVLDLDASNITITSAFSRCLGGCDLTATFNDSAETSWTPTASDDSWEISNFIDWTYAADSGYQAFLVSVDLVFSQPDPASTTANGGTIVGSLSGTVTNGILAWNDTPPLQFAQGSVLDVDLEGGFIFALGNSYTSGVTFTGNPAAPVPLPASGLLLLGGLGGLALLRRRRGAGEPAAALA